MTDLKALARFSDGLAFVYLEHAVLEREDRSVAAFTALGRISLPAAAMGCLMLGPGTRITHAAVKALTDNGAVIAWVGEDGLRHYASGIGKTRSAANLQIQAKAWVDPAEHAAVVRRMYTMRFTEPVSAAMTLQQIRGREGARVRDAYQAAARQWGVEWTGRAYKRDDWQRADPVNRALSAANAALYAVCLAGVVSSGYSPGLGFIHVGKQLSFVYDLADLYKLDLSVPAAFEAAASAPDSIESNARRLFRQRAYEARLLDRVVGDLARLFSQPSGEAEIDDSELPLSLWDPDGDVPGGIRHGDPGS